MKIDIEYFELMRQQYVALFAEQMRAIKALAAELHEINCLYRQLRSSVPHDELVNSSAVKKVLRHRLGEAGRPRGRGKGSTRGRVKAPRTSAGAG